MKKINSSINDLLNITFSFLHFNKVNQKNALNK